MKRRVRLDPAFALAVCYLLAAERSVWGLLSLAAAGLHELGHLGAAVLLGIRPTEFSVGALGARMGLSVPLLSYRHELLIAAAGPGVNLLCIPPCLWGIRHLGNLDGAGEYLLFFAAGILRPPVGWFSLHFPARAPGLPAPNRFAFETCCATILS